MTLLPRQSATIDTLRHCPLFANLPDETLTAISSVTVPKSVRKGSFLFLENAPIDGFYIVQRGAIKLHRLNFKGHEQVFHLFRPVESFGEELLFSKLGYRADASATENSHVLLVRKIEFLRLLQNHRELSVRLLRSAGERVCSLMTLLDDLKLKDAPTRVANWLIQHCSNPRSVEPESIELHSTKQVLASELGVASETLSRTLHKLRDDELVLVDGRTVTLLCPARLAQFVRNRMETEAASEPDSADLCAAT